MIFLNKGYIRGRVYYITPLIWLGSALQALAWLMFIQHLLSLPFVQRKEFAFRWLQQLRAGTWPVPASQLVLGLSGSASCMHGFLPEELQMRSLNTLLPLMVAEGGVA